MSTRCRHDITGCKSRLYSALGKWKETVATAEESWNDATAKEFYQKQLGDVDPIMTRMIASLQEAIEMVQSFEKRVIDTDKFD
jgi:uncharacterized protein YukE